MIKARMIALRCACTLPTLPHQQATRNKPMTKGKPIKPTPQMHPTMNNSELPGHNGIATTPVFTKIQDQQGMYLSPVLRDKGLQLLVHMGDEIPQLQKHVHGAG